MKKASLEQTYSETGLTPHMEDYIETIQMLSEENRVVRVKDIASKLGIKMPSVTAALDKLSKMELIFYEKYGYIELTEKGKEIADNVYNKHRRLTILFNEILGMEPEKAESQACRIEHHLTAESCVKLHKLIDFYISEQEKGSEWTRSLKKTLS